MLGSLLASVETNPALSSRTFVRDLVIMKDIAKTTTSSLLAKKPIGMTSLIDVVLTDNLKII